MNIRLIRENLGRVKACYLRNETLRALHCCVAALRDIGASSPPTDVRSGIREAVQYLARDERVKSLLPSGSLAYTPGREQALLGVFEKILAALEEAEGKESSAAALERKLKIDHAYNAGIKLLEQGRVSEADASFAEAVSSYRDEHRLFHMIAGALIDAKEPVRAGPYLKRGLRILPDDPDLSALLERARALRQEAGR
jgi:tetratricopeptide (TPR) repeat protein